MSGCIIVFENEHVMLSSDQELTLKKIQKYELDRSVDIVINRNDSDINE